MTRSRASVVIADDHPLVRDALAEMVKRRADLELLATASDGREALELIERLTPDVAVLDLRMPGLSGLQVLAALIRDARATRVLMLSGDVDRADAYAALQQGAAGFLDKQADRDEILDAIATVARGGNVLGRELHDGLVAEIRNRRDDEETVLSPRELQVLRLTAQGKSGPQIGQELHLSPATIKTHLQRVYERLGVADRAAAVAEGMRRGLIE